MQKGYVFQKSGAWYVRYYEKRRDGRLVRHTKHLGYLKHHPTKASIEPVLDAFMRSVNTVTLDEFIEFRYLPYTKELRPSTHDGYRKLWSARIKGLPEAKLRVRDYHPVDVQALLNAIAAKKLLASSTLRHVKAFLSGCFRYAVFSGVRETNPVHECRIPRGGKPPRKTYAYSLGEIQKILLVLEGAYRAALAVAAFAGLRLAELQGLRWEDYDGRDLSIKQTVWRGHVSDPKSEASKDYVPVIPSLKVLLDEYRVSPAGAATAGGRMFPSLYKAHVGIAKALAGTGVKWRGWHAFRRGLATNLAKMGVPSRVISRIMRHSSVAVTDSHYIKVRDERVDEAMAKLSLAVGSRIAQA